MSKLIIFVRQFYSDFVVFVSFSFFSHTDVNCVQEVQNKCENSAAPFEVLVQGPSGNRFVRSLVLADGSEADLETIDPKHVSTFSIYQPKHLVKRDIEADVAEAIAGTGKMKFKYRSLIRIKSFENFGSLDCKFNDFCVIFFS